MISDKNCWNCKYQNIDNDTFLGLCMWFKIHKSDQPKDIPSEKVDIGCRFFEPKST